jgi:hypothetical protein
MIQVSAGRKSEISLAKKFQIFHTHTHIHIILYSHSYMHTELITLLRPQFFLIKSFS